MRIYTCLHSLKVVAWTCIAQADVNIAKDSEMWVSKFWFWMEADTSEGMPTWATVPVAGDEKRQVNLFGWVEGG